MAPSHATVSYFSSRASDDAQNDEAEIERRGQAREPHRRAASGSFAIRFHHKSGFIQLPLLRRAGEG
jgi:hypothetical protein